MATDYPIEITDPDGSVRIAGLADFTDPDNQPQPPGPPSPFQPEEEGDVVVVEDSNGDAAYTYSDDTSHTFAHGKVVTENATIGAADSLVSFFGAGGTTQPAVPATPLPQDIVDALVALGLVSQNS